MLGRHAQLCPLLRGYTSIQRHSLMNISTHFLTDCLCFQGSDGIGDPNCWRAGLTRSSCGCSRPKWWCNDDPTFTDEAGFTCADWVGLDCVASSTTYSAGGQEALLVGCAQTCRECQQWRGMAECWNGVFTHTDCCDTGAHGASGNSACWTGGHTYDACQCEEPKPPLDAIVLPCSTSGSYSLAGCPLDDVCAVGMDNCYGNNHICLRTGPGQHTCKCPANAYGTACSAGFNDTACGSGSSPGCTPCLPQAGCMVPVGQCSTVLVVVLECHAAGALSGYYVTTDGTVTACAAGTYSFAGETNTARCDTCTSQTGCQTDGTTCSTVSGLETKLVCTPAGGADNFFVDAQGTTMGCGSGTFSAAGEDSITACDPIICAADSTIDGYDISQTVNLDLSLGPLDVTVACAANFEGTAQVAACTVSGNEYVVSGCVAVVCASDTTTAGYISIVEAEMDTTQAGGFVVAAACASGYEGSAIAARCTHNGGEYSLRGCAPIVCTRPGNLAGYNQPAETNLDLSAGQLQVSLSCASGYEGVASVACVTSGDYAVAGCTAIVCTTPTDLTGFNTPNEINLDLSRFSMSVSVSCAPGFEGTATTSSCSSSGPYTIGGCRPIECTTPANLPPGYTTPVVTNLNLAAGPFDVSSSCASGYEGTAAIACNTGGPFRLSGCSPIVCTTSSDLVVGYNLLAVTNLDLSAGAFAVSAECSLGYLGTAVAAPCSTSAPFTLSGCVAVVCTTPTVIAGYNQPTENLLNLAMGLGFDVSVTCAPGFEGNALARPCMTSGPYALTGCAPIICATPSITGYGALTEINVDLSVGPVDVTGSCAAGCKYATIPTTTFEGLY